MAFSTKRKRGDSDTGSATNDPYDGIEEDLMFAPKMALLREHLIELNMAGPRTNEEEYKNVLMKLQKLDGYYDEHDRDTDQEGQEFEDFVQENKLSFKEWTIFWSAVGDHLNDEDHAQAYYRSQREVEWIRGVVLAEGPMEPEEEEVEAEGEGSAKKGRAKKKAKRGKLETEVTTPVRKTGKGKEKEEKGGAGRGAKAVHLRLVAARQRFVGKKGREERVNEPTDDQITSTMTASTCNCTEQRMRAC